MGIKERRQKMHRKNVIRLILLFLMAGAALCLYEGRTSNNQVQETSQKKKTVKKKDTYNREELEKKGCPETLLNLADRNPEARDFVKGYFDYDSATVDRDVSGEVQKGTIPQFIQWDKRWGYEQYGDNFMAVTGCGPTCLSMVYCGLTGNTDMNPYEMAKKADAEGLYVDGQGSLWSMMETLASELGLQVTPVSVDEESIRAELSTGHVLICVVGPGEFTDIGHFLVLRGLSENGNILLNDPNSRLNSEKEWEFSDLLPQIEAVWSYTYE